MGVGGILEDVDVEDGRHVAAAGDLVGRRAVRPEAPVPVPPQLFHRHPAHALHEPALDLAEIDRRIQRGTAILQNIGAQHPVLPGQRVDGDLGDAGAVGVVEERAALHRLAVPVDVGGAVEAGGRQRDALRPAHLRELVEGEAPVAGIDAVVGEADLAGRDPEMLGRDAGHPLLDPVGRVQRRHAVEVGARRRRGGRGVGHLVGRGGRDPDPVEVDLERLRDHLGDLDVEPLPHLGAAVVQVDAAVGIDMDQRAGLVEALDVEGDAELDRHHRDALLDHRAGLVERGDLAPSRLVVGALADPLHHLPDDVVVDDLAVGRDVPRRIAVIVGAAHRLDVDPERAGDVLDRELDDDHPLRPAEAAEGGVGDRVGLAAIAAEMRVRDVVAIVGVAERAPHHRGREVGHVPRPRGEQDVEPGDDHVLVAREPQLRRQAGRARQHGGDGRDDGRLALLAAERAAHPPDLDGDRVGRHAECVRDAMLHLGRVLGRGIDQHVGVFLRHGERDLAFEVEMILPAAARLAGDPVRRGGDRSRRVAPLHRLRFGDIALALQRLLDGEHGFQHLVLDRDQRRRPPRGVAIAGGDRSDRVADIFGDSVGEDRLVREDRRDVVDPRYVGGGDDGAHPRESARLRAVDGEDSGMRVRTGGEPDLLRARNGRHVVDIDRASGDVLLGAVVAPCPVDPALERRSGHKANTPVGASPPAVWSRRRSRRLAATVAR